MSDPRGVVARGHIRVDARRAVAKLRDSLLVDLHAYLLEIVRCAVATGATAVDVAYDADDVYVRFDGAPFSQADLGHLLDYAVNETRDPSTAPLRLLALGVNAALGLRPHWVDVYTSESEERTRFQPELIEEAAARLSIAERGAPPDGRGVEGTCVHLRRRVAWEFLRRAVTGDAPPEIALLESATDHLPITLRIQGKPADTGPKPLLRVRMAEFSRAALVVVREGAGPARIEFLEHGVRMIAAPFPPAFQASFAEVSLPVRAFVDSEALPSNASRSALREDSGFADRAADAVRTGMVEAVAALTHLVTGRGECPASVEILDRDPVALENALGAFACVAHGALRSQLELPPALLAVLDEPLFRDGTGKPWSATHFLAASVRWQLYAHRGDSPLADEFSPWMTAVVWLRGRTAERLLNPSELRDLASVMGGIREGVARRARLLSHPASGPVLPDHPAELARERFSFDAGELRGLRGEARVLAPSAGSELARSTVRAFVEDRLIETFDLGDTGFPIPMELAVAWDGRIVATVSYDGVVRNEPLSVACRQAARAAVAALGRTTVVLDRLAAQEAQSYRALLRAGLGFAPDAAMVSGIDRAAIWATTDGRWLSLAELMPYARQTGGLCFVRKGHSAERGGPALDARPVLALDELDLRCLRAALGDSVVLVGYEAGIEQARKREQSPIAPSVRGALDQYLRKLGAASGPVMPFARPGLRGWLAVASDAIVVRSHAGIPLSSSSLHAGFTAMSVDEEAIVPSASWDGVLWPKEPSYVAEAERELFDTVLAALSGDARAMGLLTPPISPASLESDSLLRAYVLHTAARLRDSDASAGSKTPATWKRVEQLPVVSWLDANGLPAFVSAETVGARHGQQAPIPLLGTVPGFATFDWHPVIAASPPERRAILAWFADRAVEADGELASRRASADAQGDYRRLMAREVVDRESVSVRAAPTLPFVYRASKGAAAGPDSVSVCVAPLRKDHLDDGPWVEVLFQGRPLRAFAWPEVGTAVAARVNLESSSQVRAWRELADQGRTDVLAAIRRSLPALGEAIVRAARDPGTAAIVFSSIPALDVLADLMENDSTARFALSVLIRDIRVPTVQGGQAKWSELLSKEGTVLPIGTERYAAWVGPSRKTSSLDPPILHVPDSPLGACLRRILVHMGYALEDATSALKRLQARRMAHGSGPPRLQGTPLHPLLRADLSALKVHGADGELELIPGPESDVAMVEGDGTTRAVPADLPVPIRAVVLPSSFDDSRENTKRILLAMQRAVIRHLDSLAGHLDELPEFVREQLRSAACKRMKAQQEPSEAIARAPVFPDIRGTYHPLSLLLSQGTVSFTELQAPYPSRAYEGIVLRLNEAESTALALRVQLQDMGETIRRDLEAERRRSAPTVPAAIAEHQRGRCLLIVQVDESGTTGEVGLLAPANADLRAIEIHVEHRPLCTIEDGDAWPLLACVNDMTSRPNAYHDALDDPGTAASIRGRVRTAADREMRTRLAAPLDALASRWLDTASIGSAIVTGSLWLPAVYPDHPAVRVWSTGTEPATTPLYASTQADFDGSVPVGGMLLVSKPGGLPGPAEWAALGRVALREANAMRLQLERHGAASPVLDSYRWALALIANQPGGPQAATVTGAAVKARAIRAELSARGCLWLTAHPEMASPSRFPGPPPEFVLLDDGGPLVRVLKHRAAAVLRELAPRDRSGQSSVAIAQPQASQSPAIGSSETAEEPPDELPVAKSWLDRVQQRISQVLDGETRIAESADPLRQELERVIRRVPSIQRVELEYATRGRPVRFDARTGRLLVNRKHPVIARVLAAPRPDMHRIIAEAALSEINRELEAVTDAEERRALVELMQQT